MPRKQAPVVDYAVYLAARCAVSLFQILSHSALRTLIAGLAWAAFLIDRRHRLIALDNLRKAFPGRYREAELKGLVLATYRHFFTVLVEISRLPRKMHRHNSSYYFDM